MKDVILSENVSFQYLHTESPFLKNINLKVSQGECILICGPSGCGKSTFARLLNGISPNYVEGDLTGSLDVFNLRAGLSSIEDYVPIVASVFQNPKTQHFTVDTTSELAFPLENMGIDPDKILDKIKEKSQAFGTSHLLNRNIFKLSGGEKQQIAFVSANMTDPKLLILDELTSNLDQDAIIRIHDMIELLKKKGTTIIIFEHRLSWAKDLVDRYIMLKEGQIVQEWSNEEFNKLSNKELHSLGLRSNDLAEYKKIIDGKALKEKDIKKKTGNKDLLQIDNLDIGYPDKKVCSGINLSFRQGQVTALIGSNGIGKTTLANTLTGLQKPLSGRIIWAGKEITSKELIKKSYMVMQDMNYQLFCASVEEEVLLGAKHPEYMDEVLDILNLTEFKDRHPMSLSEGQKQRVAIASALLSGKELIIFDEPTSGLDYFHMKQFGKLINKLKETNTIIIVITHDEELAAKWSDSIVKLE